MSCSLAHVLCSMSWCRNDDDWARVWHVERHRRCYHELLSHMNWVCEKDIYKMRRRKRDAPSLEKDAGNRSRVIPLCVSLFPIFSLRGNNKQKNYACHATRGSRRKEKGCAMVRKQPFALTHKLPLTTTIPSVSVRAPSSHVLCQVGVKTALVAR